MKKLVLCLLLAVASTSFGQHSLQTDDGAGHYSLITAPGTGPLTFVLPSTPGTLLTVASANSAFWALGGNASPSSSNLGTTTADPINFITGSGGPNTRMSISSAGAVSINGTSFSIGGVSYTWPAAQAGAANDVLTNDGAGGLSWAPGGGGGGGTPGGANTQVQYNNAGAFGASANFTYSGTVLGLNNADVLVANSDNTARTLKLYEPNGSGTNFTAFMAQAQAADLTYTLPAVQGAASSMLSNDGAGTLSWALVANSNIAAAAGIVYSKLNLAGSIAIADLSATGTPSATTFLRGDNTWSTISAGTPAGANTQVQYNNSGAFGASANFVYSGTAVGLTNADVQIGNNDNTARGLKLYEPSTSGTNFTAFMAQAQGADVTYTLPPAQGAATTVLTNDGSGNLTWTAGGGTATPGGPNNSLQYNNAGVLGGSANLTYSGTVLGLNDGDLQILNDDNTARTLKFFEPSGSGTNFTAFKAQAQAADLTYTLPPTQGAASSMLSNDGAGNLSWTLVANANVAAAAGIVYSKLTLTNSIVNADVAAAAGIVYSKLTLTNSIVNADVAAGAAIVYSKLNLSNSILGSDIAAGTQTTTNVFLALGNNNNTAAEFRLLEPSGSGVNYTAFKAQAQAANVTYVLPNAQASAASQVLTNDGAGNLSWAAAGATPAGANTQLQFNNSGAFGGSANLTFVSTTALTLTNTPLVVANSDNTARELRLAEPSTSGANYTGFKAQAQAADVHYILPNAQASASNQVLTNDGAGNLSWALPTAGSLKLNITTGSIPNGGNFNISNEDIAQLTFNGAGNTSTATLPAAGGASAGAGKIVIIKIIGVTSNANVFQLRVQAAETLDGNNNAALAGQNINGTEPVRRVYSDGTNWFTW